MQSTLLEQAFELLVFGMGTVFVFLALLVVSVNVMSRLIQTCFPEPIVADVQSSRLRPNRNALDNKIVDPKTLTIIQAAIRQHRDRTARR